MKFENIKFCDRSRGSHTEVGLALPGGYWVQKTFFDLAWKLASAGLRIVNWRVPQTAETLCNDPTWKERKVGARLKLGRCIKCFADSGMLLIKVANPGKKGKRKYVQA